MRTRLHAYAASLLIAFAVASDVASNGLAADPSDSAVIVQTTRGKMSGRIDARTDESRLWLRQEHPSTTLLRCVAWGEVREARVAGEMLSAAELRRMSEISENGDRLEYRRRADPPPQDPHRRPYGSLEASDADRARRLLGFAPADRFATNARPQSVRGVNLPREVSSRRYAGPGRLPPR